MDITTSSKRSFLEDAWDAAQVGVVNPALPNLRAQLRSRETATNATMAGGSIASVTANGRSTVFALPSQATYTPKQMSQLWRELVDLYDSTRKFLEFCALYDLDADDVDLNGAPSQLPAVDPDPTAVTDATIFTWMMDHLIAITEIRSDFSGMRSYIGGVV